jgi:hypothetical protein
VQLRSPHLSFLWAASKDLISSTVDSNHAICNHVVNESTRRTHLTHSRCIWKSGFWEIYFNSLGSKASLRSHAVPVQSSCSRLGGSLWDTLHPAAASGREWKDLIASAGEGRDIFIMEHAIGRTPSLLLR